MVYNAKVFLSYAREDRLKVEKLYIDLQEAGFKPWMDSKDIVAGEDWEKAVWRAVKDANFFIVCLSKKSVVKRGFLQKEIKQAIDIWKEKLEDDIYLIPILLEPCNVPNSLKQFQWIDFFKDDGFSLLLEGLETGIERSNREREDVKGIGEAGFITKEISETGHEELAYDLNVSYPFFVSLENDSEREINPIIEGFIWNIVQIFRRDCVLHSYQTDHRSIVKNPSMFDDLYITFKVILLSQYLISILFIHSRYFSGAAHPQHYTECLNFQLKPLFKLHLLDIFSDSAGAIEIISDYCIKDLQNRYKTEEEYSLNEESKTRLYQWISEGAGPKEENFKVFSLNVDGLDIIFDPYQVGPYSAGRHLVSIPWYVLKSYINPHISSLPILNFSP